MASSSDRIFNTQTNRFAIPVGATNALLLSQDPKVGAIIAKQLSGGTLFIIGVTASGITYTATELASLAAQSYFVGGSEILNLGGPSRMYMYAEGATAVVCLLKGVAGDS